ELSRVVLDAERDEHSQHAADHSDDRRNAEPLRQRQDARLGARGERNSAQRHVGIRCVRHVSVDPQVERNMMATTNAVTNASDTATATASTWILKYVRRRSSPRAR